MRDSALRVTKALRPPQASLLREGLSGWLPAMAASRDGGSPSAFAHFAGRVEKRVLRDECGFEACASLPRAVRAGKTSHHAKRLGWLAPAAIFFRVCRLGCPVLLCVPCVSISFSFYSPIIPTANMPPTKNLFLLVFPKGCDLFTSCLSLISLLQPSHNFLWSTVGHY